MEFNKKNCDTSKPLDEIYENNEKERILKGEWLSDLSVHKFHLMLSKASNFKPRDTLLFINHINNRNAKRIQPMSFNEEHLQIIHTHRDHWICVYFNKKDIAVYNSIHKDCLTIEEEIIVKALFPFF